MAPLLDCLIVEKGFINLCTNCRGVNTILLGRPGQNPEARQVKIWLSASPSRTAPLRRKASLAVYS
jgi:hypothetical protein